MKNITITGLLVVYKKTNHLWFKNALESLIYQTVDLNEIVIVCDGPANSKVEEIIFKKLDQRIKYYKLKHNRGLGYCLRFGIKKSNSNWILRMDDDDISNLERIQKQLDFLIKNPHLDVIGAQIEERSNDLKNFFGFKICPLDHHKICVRLNYQNSINHVSVLLKKSSVLKAGNYKSNTIGFEDYELWMRMRKANFKFGNLSETLVTVRFDNAQIQKRSGIKSSFKEFNMQRYFFKQGYINKKQFILNIIIRVIPKLTTNNIYRFILKRFTRTRKHQISKIFNNF